MPFVRTEKTYRSVLSVPCRTCGAERGEACRGRAAERYEVCGSRWGDEHARGVGVLRDRYLDPKPYVSKRGTKDKYGV